MATCTFCGNPAAHPATGSAYGPRTLACASCTREFWKWLQQHTKGKGRRKGPGFYEHVKAICPTCRGRFSRGERCKRCPSCPGCCVHSDRSAPFAPPKFTGHRERSQETISSYPVGTDFGWYVRATARELEKLVRHSNTGDNTLNQQQIDYTVSKSLMRCGEHMKQNFSTGKTPEWAAKNTYRLCVEQIYWPWPIRNMPYGPAGRYEFGARSRHKR